MVEKETEYTALPLISVIIPVLNNPEGIASCIEGLLEQDYPTEKMEIIVIDNGSVDETRGVVKQYTVSLMNEGKVKSPYAARNRGLEAAKGKIIAFTDSDCIPDTSWLSNAERVLRDPDIDMIGGHVSFRFSRHHTAGELYDSLINLEVKNNVRERGVAKTGNLIVDAELFERIGLFDPTIRSGGDVRWTGRATREGFRLVYRDDVIVYKKARSLGALLKKQVRVGAGQPKIWKEQGRERGEIVAELLQGLKPVRPGTVREMIAERGADYYYNKLFALTLVAWLCRLSLTLGRIKALIKR